MNHFKSLALVVSFVLVWVVATGYSASDSETSVSALADKVVVTQVGGSISVLENPRIWQYGDKRFILGTSVDNQSGEKRSPKSKLALALDAVTAIYIYDDIDSYVEERRKPTEEQLRR